MDLEKVIRDLYFQKQKLERIIAQLEELHRAAVGSPVVSDEPKRRGRKQMSQAQLGGAADHFYVEIPVVLLLAVPGKDYLVTVRGKRGRILTSCESGERNHARR